MAKASMQGQITEQLRATNVLGGYLGSILCTHEGLLVASHGAGVPDERLAAFTSLFDDIVLRAQRDLGLGAIDEVTLLEEGARLIIRPVNSTGTPRLFLVVSVPVRATWRRYTNRLVRELQKLIVPIVADEPGGFGAAAFV